MSVCLCVINCQEELLAARGSGRKSVDLVGPVSVSPVFRALAAICQHVGSQVQLPLVWVKIHPLRTPCRFFVVVVVVENMGEFSPRTYGALNYVCFVVVEIFVFHKRTESFASTRGESS